MCPGQGSQTPGFLLPWLDLPGVPEQLATFSEAAGTDLGAHGSTSDAGTIRDTAVAQPLIVAASLVTLRALLAGQDAAGTVDVTAGHSVGELAAAATAGVLTDVGAVALVRERARAMARAAALAPTGMSAVVGGEPDEVLAAIAAAGLHPANVNAAGQVVAAGALEDLARLADAPPPRARVIPLAVAGAFHTPSMQPALDEFGPVAAAWSAADPRLPLLTDLDGTAYGPGDGADPSPGGAHGHGLGRTVLDHLARQVVAPVRWDLCQATLLAMGVTGMVELAPGGVLTGLARRSLPGVETLAVKTPADLDAARDLVRRHAGAHITPEEHPA